MLKVKCIYEPRGNHGLEGYELNKLYRFTQKPDKSFRIFPDDLFYPNYREICSKRIFNKYFKEVMV